MDDDHLFDALLKLRTRGAIGENDIRMAIAHADQFVVAIPVTARLLLDLGSGGGLPALVIAVRRPELHVTMTDRRERRLDLVRQACARLGLAAHVEVVVGDVRQLARRQSWQASFDVVTARAFGPPVTTLRCARPFLRNGGRVVVSESPPLAVSGGNEAQRWTPRAVDDLGYAEVDQVPGVRCFAAR